MLTGALLENFSGLSDHLKYLSSFIKTNQSDVLDTSSLPSLVGDIKNICGLESALLGNVSGADASLTAGAPIPTSSASASTVSKQRVSLKIATAIIVLGLFIG